MYENDKSVNYEEAEEEDLDMFEKDLLEDAQWKLIQQNTFTRWANEKLKAVSKHIVDLESDLSDGLRLINLIEVLSQKQLPKHSKKPIFRSQKLENVSVALKFLDDEGIRIVNIEGENALRTPRQINIRPGYVGLPNLVYPLKTASTVASLFELPRLGDFSTVLHPPVSNTTPT